MIVAFYTPTPITERPKNIKTYYHLEVVFINTKFMKTNTVLLSVLPPQDYCILLRALKIRDELKNLPLWKYNEPIFTLQQNYFAPVWRMSPKTISLAINNLCRLGLLRITHQAKGVCTSYQIDIDKYHQLVRQAKGTRCIIKTSYGKTPQEITASKALNYNISKSIVKEDKRREKRKQAKEDV